MQATLYANLTTRTLSDSLAGTQLTFPKIVAGDDLTLRLRLSERIDGTNYGVARTLVGMKASIGMVDTPPVAGTFALYCGAVRTAANTTAALAYNVTAAQLQAALNALTDVAVNNAKPCTVTDEDGVLVVHWKDGIQVPIHVARNALRPVAKVQMRKVFRDSGRVSAAVAEVTTISFTGLTGADIDDAEWTIYDDEGPVVFSFGSSFTGAPGGRAVIVNDYTNTTTDEELAIALASALSDDPGFTFSRSGAVLTLTNIHAGARIDPVVGAAPDVTVTTQGVNSASLNDGYHYGLRLIQYPGAITTTSQLAQPSPPRIEAVRNGGMNGDVTWNEVQKLVVPADYRGQYEIKRGYKRTIALNEEDDEASITEALAALADEGGSFVTNNVASGELLIEFTGIMGGTNQSLLEINLLSASTPDIAFTIATQTDNFAKLLRLYRDTVTKETKLVLEIELTLEDVEDPEVEQTVTWRADLSFVGEINWPELADAPVIDWLRPPLPERIYPFDYSQIANGVQHYQATIGNGSATTVTIDHMLGSAFVFLNLRLAATGLVLVHGTDYSYAAEGSNSIEVTFLGDYATDPPALNAIAATVIALGTASQFDPHTHEIEEVTDLRAELDALAERLAALEDAMPGSGVGSTVTASAGTTLLEVPLPSIFELYPARTQIDSSAITRVIDVPLSVIGRDGALLPAIHDKTITNLSAILSGGLLPDVLASYKGKVIKNNTGIVHYAPGGGQRKGFKIWPDEHITTDGRYWFKVVKLASDTWYPAEMERELMTFTVNGNMLPVGKTLELRVGFELAILTRKAMTLAEREFERIRESATARWKFVIEMGYITAQSGTVTPAGDSDTATVGPNISAVSWQSTALVEQVLTISRVPQVHTMGLRLKRTADTTFTGTALRYAQSSNAGTTPTDSSFVLRARLTQFDVNESDVANPLGVVALMGLNRGLMGAADDTLGKITIK